MPRVDVGEISTVVVVDDHYLIIESLSRAIDDHPELDLVGTASDGEEGLELIGRARPRVALVELPMGGSAAGIIALANAIAELSLATRVLLLPGYSDAGPDDMARRAGAVFFAKDATACEIAQAIIDTVANAAVISSAPQPAVRERLRTGRGNGSLRCAPELSCREAETLGLTSEGLGAKQIAWRLGVSEDTVRTFLKRAYRKLGAANAAAAVTEAMRRGLLE